jgi:lysozyme
VNVAQFSTSEQGYDLIKRFEGCELTAYKKGADPWTVGWGQTGMMPDGRLVREGLTITQREADDALQFFVRNVVDPMVRKHFVCRTQAEHDACASWVYNINHSKLERGEYSLPNRVNAAQRDLQALIALWMRYVNPGTIFQTGLARRRVAELCLFFGYPWNAPSVMGLIFANRHDTMDVDFILDVAAAAFEAEQPKKAAVVKPVVTEPLPEIDPTLPPKPMEASKTHRGLSKKESGTEAIWTGAGLTGLAALLPYIDAITVYVAKYSAATIFTAAGVIGVSMIGVGAWRWWAGRMIAHEGRLEAKQGKV